MNTISQMTPSHAALLSWSISPEFSRPEVANDTLFPLLTNDINSIMAK
jgi:hypothetical protein